MAQHNVINYVKKREINDQISSNLQRHLHVTDAFVNRLGLEKELEGHQGCVNCLEWNSEGRLLASASDDFQVILWDPFHYRKVQTIQTGHHGNIFSVKFLPLCNDNVLVTGAGDYQVHVYDVTIKETIQMCTCATARVKRLAVAPQVPYLFWSASEDGAVRQFDLRSPHSCTGDANNVLVYLRTHLGHFAEAKCLAINPQRPELLAVGANDPYVRLYDRRMIKLTNVKVRTTDNLTRSRNTIVSSHMEHVKFENNLSEGCVEYYVAGHLSMKQYDKRSKFRNLAATYLTFSPNGIDLLLNLGGEQIYLFDITKKRPPKAFDIPRAAMPKELCSSSHSMSNGYHTGTNGYSSGSLPKEDSNKQPLPDFAENMKLTANMLFEKEEYARAIRLYNEAINRFNLSAVLYGNRAAALMKRNWDGDMYAALRDCHTTLQLDPDHMKAFFRLARCLNELHWTDKARACLEAFMAKFPSHVSSYAIKSLETDLNSATSPSPKSETEENELSKEEDEEGLAGIKNSSQEWKWRESAFDYEKRFYGHCNTTTDIKEANFFGCEGQYIIAGSDDGSMYFWERGSTNNVRILRGDSSIVNCLQPHPTYCMLATSGIDPVVRLWSPRPEDGKTNEHEVKDKDDAASSNQRRMKADPFDVVLMNMSYRQTSDSNVPALSCQTS